MCRKLILTVLALSLCLISSASADDVNWTAYIDLNAWSGGNHANVLEIVPTSVYPGPYTEPFVDPNTNWVLKDFDTGNDLPVTINVAIQCSYPTANGGDSDVGTDADLLFGGIVNGQDGYELKAADGDYATVTFDNLNPGKQYMVALTHNRNSSKYGDRAAICTLSGVDTSTNTSSAGVVVNSEDSVSFSPGDNATNGYVAQWTDVTAADGSFSITAEHDDSFGGSKGYAMTSIMLQELADPAQAATVNWDFENGNDHGFALWSVVDPIPGDDDPNTAGDETLTGGLPEAGLAWTIGSPDMFDGLLPAVEEGCHVDANGLLQYGPCNDPFSAAVGDPPYDFTNGRGQSGYLNTYNLSQWGDGLHAAENDQIATSRPVLLYAGAQLTTWAFGNTTASWAGGRAAPELDPNDPKGGYVSNTGGIAVLSAEDGSLLASLLVAAEGGDGNMPGEFSLDLSDFAGQEVIIEAVDAFAGGWGWLCFDEIQITNAVVTWTEPDSIAGLLAWYDAQAITGAADGDAVALWPDESGNGRDATQDDDMYKPVYVADAGNGLPAVRFDTDWLEAVFSADGIELPITVFVVHKVTSATLGNQNIIDGGSAGPRFRLGYNPPGEPLFATFQTWPPALNANIAIETPMPDFTVATALYNEPGARSALRVDGEEKASSESMTSHRLVDITIGSRTTRDRQWFFGDIAEMIFYERALADGELAAVESYLAHKYGFGLAP